MDFRRSTGKYPPIPSRGSSEGGVGIRQPIPYQPQSDLNSGSGSNRDEDCPPPPECKCRPEPTPTILRSSSSTTHVSPSPFPDSSKASNSSSRTKRAPTNFCPGPETRCSPAQVVDLYRHPEPTQVGYDDPASNRETTACLREATFTEDDGYRAQGTYKREELRDQDHPRYRRNESGQQTESKMLEGKSSEIKSQRHLQKGQYKQQKATTSTTNGRPEWKITTRSACKPMSIYPEPFKPLPPVPKYHSPSVRPSESRMKPESEISLKQSQISASLKPSKANAKRGQSCDSRPSTEIRPTSASDLQPYQERRVSQVYNETSPTFLPERSGIQSVARLIHYEDENIRIDAENSCRDRDVDFSVEPSTERIRDECANLMQRLTAELALTKGFPKEQLCVRLSLSEELTADGKRKSFTICEPSCTAPVNRTQEECPEVYATPSAPSPRSVTPVDAAKSKVYIQEQIKEVASDHKAKCPPKKTEPQQKQERPLPPQDEEPVPKKAPYKKEVSAPQDLPETPKRKPLPKEVSVTQNVTVTPKRTSSPKEETPKCSKTQEVMPVHSEIQIVPPKRTSSPKEETSVHSKVQEVMPVPSETQIVPPKRTSSPKEETSVPSKVQGVMPVPSETQIVPPKRTSSPKEETSVLSIVQKVMPVPSRTQIVPPEENEPVAPSIEEILPPTTPVRVSAPEVSPPPTKPQPDRRAQVPPTEFAAESCVSLKEPQVCQDRLGARQTAENEALNTEFLYYSSALKNLLPVLYPEDRSRLVPWVKKLFSPEYCARLLRDKRNRFLLHFTVVLCNDEVIGVFRNPPPEGTLPSVDELCSTRYPPAAWECDSAWLDHLEDVPPGVARMPCPWHPSGCPETTEQPAKSEGSCPNICYPWRQYGTSCEVARGWSLDQEFKLLLYLSRPLKPLMKMSKDRIQMMSWLRYLCTVTPDCCVALRSLRNDYVKLLLAYGQDDRMTGPFAREPVWGVPLPPLGDHGDEIQARPFADPASGDVDEFLRSVPVPNEGAFCYVAVDGIPVIPITRPSASASLLQR